MCIQLLKVYENQKGKLKLKLVWKKKTKRQSFDTAFPFL